MIWTKKEIFQRLSNGLLLFLELLWKK